MALRNKKVLLSNEELAVELTTGALSAFSQAKADIEEANELLNGVIKTNVSVIEGLSDDNVRLQATVAANEAVAAKLGEFVPSV